MILRRLPLPTAIVVLAALASALPAFSATKLDLSPYLGQLRMPGDFKLYEWSTGGQRKVTTLAVQPWAKGWAFLSESRLTGTPDGDSVSNSEGYLIPGKQLLGGNQFYEGFAFVVSKPVKGLKLRTTLGKPQQTKLRAALFVNGQPAGGVQRIAYWAAQGFETVTTPSGTYPAALRARAASGLRIVDGFGEYVYFYDETLWYAETLGLVKLETHVESYEDGVLVDEQAWTEELASGSLGGVPFPVP